MFEKFQMDTHRGCDYLSSVLYPR